VTKIKENNRPVFLMNMDAKILSETLENQIYNILKRSYIMIKLVSFQGWYNIQKSINVIQYMNRIKNQNHMIISRSAEKAFDKIQHPFMIKALKELGIGRMYCNIIKAICSKPIANIVPNGE
jgi:hypothetical protein